MKKEMTVRQLLESDEYQAKREELNREINADPFKVDYSVFHKSPEEKIRTLEMKWANLEERKNFYGPLANKYLNIPSRSMPETIHWTS